MLQVFFFFLMILRPPRSTLFPYTNALPISPGRRSSRRCASSRSGCWRCSATDRKSTRLNSSHVSISYAVFCLKKKKENSTKEDYRRPDQISRFLFQFSLNYLFPTIPAPPLT